jgi:hypothetical protein
MRGSAREGVAKESTTGIHGEVVYDVDMAETEGFHMEGAINEGGLSLQSYHC